MATYTYSLSADFGNDICLKTLTEEITSAGSGVTTDLRHITVATSGSDDGVFIVFVSVLSGAEQTALNNIIAAHVGTPCPETGDPYMRIDGTTAFTAPVSGQDPTLDNHLATKLYTDSASANALTQAVAADAVVLSSAESYSDAASANALVQANAYTDTQIVSVSAAADAADNATLASANTYSDQASANALVQAEAYADAGDTATLASANTYSDQASANALVQALAADKDTFLELTDTPADYSGKGTQLVRVNAGETALEFAPSGTGGGGGGGTFGSEFQQAVSSGTSSTSSTSYQQKLRLTTPSLPAGTYRIGWSYEVDGNNQNSQSRVELNDTDELAYNYFDSSINGYIQLGGFAYRSISGVNTIDIDYSKITVGTAIDIRRARLEIWRVS
jgi:hypothetical protein